jgi:DNA-binding protein H-NS
MPRSPKAREPKVHVPQTRLSQLLEKIESLKREAEAIKQKERAEVIARIQEAIRFYGLTASDLGVGNKHSGINAGLRARKPEAGTASRKRPSVQFADDKGNTWSGRGPRPRWFKEALAKGVQPDTLRARATEPAR